MASGVEGALRADAAVLFADVHAYSVHIARDEARTWARVLEARKLCRRLVHDYDGRLVQTVGDGIFALFPSCEQAVRFAIAFQADMAASAIWHADAQPLRFRIGIHWGEIVCADEEIYGYAISIAERLQKLAAPGGICVSEAVRACLKKASDIAWRPLGWKRLHNIDDAVMTHELDGEGPMPGAAAAAAAYPEPREEPAPPGEASLAVLPLVPLTDEPTDRHLALGISADLIHNLTRFRELLVIARQSSFRFGGDADDRATARQLGVRYLFKGTLQRHERRLRLVCELLEAESGAALWSEKFDGVLDDIFVFQDEITSTIAGRLAIQIAAAERRRETRLRPALSAYGLVLRGEELSLDLRRDSVMHARRLFEQATALDPDFGRSYAALSRTFNYEWRYAWSPEPDRSLNQALDLALAAVRQDSLDARGYAELGFAHLYRKEHAASLSAYERALNLNPNDADVIAEYADALVYDGQPERSVDLLNRAMRLNPYYPDWYLWNLADAYNDLNRPDDVVATVNRMRNPSEGRRLLAANFAHLGRLDEARVQAQEILRLHPGFTVSAWAQRPPYKNRDTLSHFVEGLRRAGLPD
jgi:adenylate cyclase